MAETGHEPLYDLIPSLFMPPQLPQEALLEEQEKRVNVLLCKSLIVAATQFKEKLQETEGVVG